MSHYEIFGLTLRLNPESLEAALIFKLLQALNIYVKYIICKTTCQVYNSYTVS